MKPAVFLLSTLLLAIPVLVALPACEKGGGSDDWTAQEDPCTLPDQANDRACERTHRP